MSVDMLNRLHPIKTVVPLLVSILVIPSVWLVMWCCHIVVIVGVVKWSQDVVILVVVVETKQRWWMMVVEKERICLFMMCM